MNESRSRTCPARRCAPASGGRSTAATSSTTCEFRTRAARSTGGGRLRLPGSPHHWAALHVHCRGSGKRPTSGLRQDRGWGAPLRTGRASKLALRGAPLEGAPSGPSRSFNPLLGPGKTGARKRRLFDRSGRFTEGRRLSPSVSVPPGSFRPARRKTDLSASSSLVRTRSSSIT